MPFVKVSLLFRQKIMPIQINFSQKIEELSKRLVQNLKLQNDPFDFPHIIIPNESVKIYLQKYISKQMGISMFPFFYLEPELKNLSQGLLLKHQVLNSPFEVMSQEKWKWSIFFTFYHYGPDLPTLFRNYLGIDKSIDPHVSSCLDLAHQLARLFLDYEHHRPEMVKAWIESEHVLSKQGENEYEKAQRELYLFIRKKVLNQNQDLISFIELSRLFSSIQPSSIPIKAKEIHLFAHFQLSPLHIQLLIHLSAYHDIYFYSINLCEELWDDMNTKKELNYKKTYHQIQQLSIQQQDGHEYLEESEYENKLLQLWGKPGRENIKILLDLDTSGAELSGPGDDLQTTTKPTILQHIQELVRTRKNYPQVKLKQDQSLQVFSAPSRKRELETIAHNILYHLNRDPKLNLSDFLVLCPNIDLYISSIKQVFQHISRIPKPALSIPYQIISSQSKPSSYILAIQTLLFLPTSTFTRKQVFELIFNPCFLRKFEITFHQAEQFLSWIDASQVFHHIDEQQKLKDDSTQSQLFTWSQALKRLRLSKWMQHETNAFDTSWNDLTPTPVEDWDLFDCLSYSLEELFNFCKEIQDKEQSLTNWYSEISTFIETFIEMSNEHQDDQSTHQKFFQSFHQLSQLEPPHAEQMYSYSSIKSMLEHLLQNLEVPIHHTSDHVLTFSTLKSARAVPYKFIYAIGLAEGEFPSHPSESSLDLKQLNRKIGDINPADSQNYMFLEHLLSTRQQLYLSYVSRDLQKDCQYLPCSTLYELIQYIEIHLIESKFKIEHLPLHLSDLKFINSNLQKHSDLYHHYSQNDHFISLQRIGSLIKKTSKETQKIQQSILQYHAPLPNKNNSSQSINYSITSRQLEQFFIDPFKTSIESSIGRIPDKPLDESEKEHEHLWSEFPFSFRFPRQALFDIKESLFLNQIKSKGECHSLIEQTYLNAQNSSQTPEAEFATLDLHNIQESLNMRIEHLLHIHRDLSPMERIQGILIGSTTTPNPTELQYPTLNFLIDSTEIDLSTLIEDLWIDTNNEIHLLQISHRKTPAKNDHTPDLTCIHPWLSMTTLSALQIDLLKNCHKFYLHILYENGMRCYEYPFLNQDLSLPYLKELTQDYLFPSRPTHLPFKFCIKEKIEKKKPWELEVITSELNQSYIENLNQSIAKDQWEFIPKAKTLIDTLEQSLPENALEKVKSRYTLFANAKVVTSS